MTARRGKKKPWRLRWPDDFRDEGLARLLELNEKRHKEELLAGAAFDETGSADAPRTKKTRIKKPPPPAR